MILPLVRAFMFMIFDNQTGTISTKFSLSISISSQDSASPFLLCTASASAEFSTSFHFLLDLERDTITKKVYINLFERGFVNFCFYIDLFDGGFVDFCIYIDCLASIAL